MITVGGATVLSDGTGGDGIPTSLLTTRGDLIRRGASAAERVALGAAGTRLRSDGTDPVWSEPDVVCTVAELATTYAPSAVLRGVYAYTTDAGVTYVCRRTAASTYAWALFAAGATAAAALAAVGAGTFATLNLETLFPRAPVQTALHQYRLDEATGTFADTGSGAIAATASGTLVRATAGPYRGRLAVSRSGTTRADCVSLTGTTIPAVGFSFALTLVFLAGVAPSSYALLAVVSNGGGAGAYNYLALLNSTTGLYLVTGKTATENSGTMYTPTFTRAMRVVVTYVSATQVQTLYVNGVSRVSQSVSSGALANCTSLTALGGAPTGSIPAGAGNGSCAATVSDVQVWNRSLTAAEVAVDYLTLAGSLL